jgi:hypothetical protein
MLESLLLLRTLTNLVEMRTLEVASTIQVELAI